MTFIAFESFAITTVLPVAMAELGGPQWYALAYSSTITAALVGMIIGGDWCDRAGPHRPLLMGGALFLCGLALCVMAPDAGTFILGRILQGLGGGIDSVVLYVLIARHIPEAARPRMFGLLTAAWIVPSMAGPTIAGALTELTTWRTVFGLILAGATIALACLLRTTRQAPRTARVPPQAVFGRRAALSFVAASLLIVLHLGAQLDPPRSIPVVLGALVGLGVVAQKILPAGTLLLQGEPQRLIALRAVLGATVTTTDLYLTLYLQTERGHPPTIAGLVISVGALGWAGGAWLQGRFSSRHAVHRRLIAFATPLISAGPATALLHTAHVLPLWTVIAGCLAMGTGMGIVYPRLSSSTLSLTDAEQHGTYSSALQVGEGLTVGAATALTAVILASSLASSTSFTLVYAVLLTLSLGAILIAAPGRLPARG
nr:MFS transporter [Nesterenkonia xinjiangensis]